MTNLSREDQSLELHRMCVPLSKMWAIALYTIPPPGTGWDYAVFVGEYRRRDLEGGSLMEIIEPLQ